MDVIGPYIAAAGPGSLAFWEAILSRAAREATDPAQVERNQHWLAQVRTRRAALAATRPPLPH